VSGFDFDALRDPDAPIPGTRQREQVVTRARRLRARARFNRAAVAATSIVAAVAIVLGVDAVTRSTGPEISVGGTTTTVSTTPTTSRASSVGDRFVPPTTLQDGLVVLPVTLPDGETFTLRYPPAMRIAQLGFAGSIGVDWPVETGKLQCCGNTINLRYTTIAHVYGNAKPVAVYHGPNGKPVPFFHASQAITSSASPAVDELVFQFGPWLVRVQDVQHSGDYADRMTDAQRATWARSLTGTVDSNGYLVLHARAPLTLTDHFEGLFGSPAARANGLEVASHLYCGQTGSDTSARRRFANGDGSRGVSWCSPGLHLSAFGASTFVDLAATELQVSPLALPLGGAAPASTTTTPTKTTKPVVAPPPFAVSASFASAATGWALEQGTNCGDVCDFQVVQTTNGGRTWAPVGDAGRLPTYSTRIRFADRSRGFVFDAENYRAAPLLETDDGGEHWKKLRTPFRSISDLAISRGIVYVVGVPAATTTNFPGFRIWSSPVNDLHWTVDPLAIPVGAGPVPEQRLVLAGDGGWMINSDRGIVSGARLSAASGRWSAWNPPCRDVNGSAVLAASTNTDLVAVCSPGFATSSTKTYIEFSHDAGTTFDRHLVPGGRFGAGGPVSPDASTAVIGQNISLRRTTDGGATWQVVKHDVSLIQQRDTLVSQAMVDFGFTTKTQGFIVYDNGLMLMTHDAGASWKQVIRP
jgi:photosystem II stability/assembly factor-like uncharacterized protein